MRRSTTWIVLFAWMFSQGAAARAVAGEPDFQPHIDAYRATVLQTKVAVAEPRYVGGGGLWAKVGSLLLLADDEAAVEEAASYVPWGVRRGPAYPNDKWRSFGRDAKELPRTLWDDTKATFTDPVVIAGALVAGAAGIVISASGVDTAIDRRTDGHRQLSKSLDGIGGFFGSPAFHFPLAALMYGTGLATEETKVYETSKTLMNALIINGLTTQILKWCCNTHAPNGDGPGWPSGHTSSTFTVATVLYKTYGPWVGVPLYAFACFVGYERIDARNHDFSDVISGMILGIVIANAVANNHEVKVFGMDIAPYVDPDSQAMGVVFTKQW